jgi:hypothetical protein
MYALPRCKSWLQRCLTSHTTCNTVSITPKVLPTRLLFVQDEMPRLCFSTEVLGQISSYATLSHCWGEHKYMKLTKKTLPGLICGIRLEDLPRTFQDAIHTTRYLGINYLWIDSLCILQDDEEDWKRESTSMATVYGNSIINIAATGAENGAIGLFFSRSSNWRCQVEAKPQNPTGEEEKNHLLECFSLETLCPALKDRPLHTRGWALQEQLLPTRTLHFAKSQIFWGCLGETVCEMFPDGIPEQHALFKSPFKINGYTDIDPWNRPSRYWASTVEAYNQRSLTLAKDKLVAIGGIARLLAEQSNDKYIVGLWEEKLEKELCWFHSGPSTRSFPKVPKSDSYVAPSWSWASIDGSIRYQPWVDSSLTSGHWESVCAKVDALQIKYESPENPFGQVLSAKLVLKCTWLVKCDVWPNDSQKLRYSGSGCDKGAWLKVRYDRMGDDTVNKTKNWYFLPIVHNIYNAQGVGLLIQPTGRAKGEYMRLGFIEHVSVRTTFWSSDSGLTYGIDFADRSWIADEHAYAKINVNGSKREYFIDLV